MTPREASSTAGQGKFQVYARQLEACNWSPSKVIDDPVPLVAGRVKIERLLVPKPLRHRVKSAATAAVRPSGATAGGSPHGV